MIKLVLFGFILGICSLEMSWAAAEPQDMQVKIAAAADLKFVMSDLIAAFKDKVPGLPVKVTYGSSGILAAQIVQNSLYDLFLSADTSYAQLLISKNRAFSKDAFQYGNGQIALWTPIDSSIEIQKGLKVLISPMISRVALANPRHAPYGRAAQEALIAAGVYQSVKNKLIFGENVIQAAHFVVSRSAPIGIIALSIAKSEVMEKKGKYFPIPRSLYSPLLQTGLILKDAKNYHSAKKFRDFLKGPQGQKILQKYGFLHPVE